MRQQKIVYYASGENQGTYDPKCFIELFDGDLNERTTRFRSYDDDHNRVEVDMYFVKTETIPVWMNQTEYLSVYVKMKFAIALAGSTFVLNLPCDDFYRFINLNERQQFWYGWARKSKSQFLQSMVFQFEQWLKGKTKYTTPLSAKQWEAAYKYCPLYKARQISTKLYYSRSF